MSYLIKVNKQQCDLLDKNNVDYIFDNLEDLVSNKSKIEIEIDSVEEYNKAIKILIEDFTK